MTLYFLESSAFAKLFVLEQGSKALIRLLDRVPDSQKRVSSLASLEVRSAIRRRQRLKEIRPADADQALTAVDAEVRRISQQSVTSAVVSTAQTILDAHPLRALDALHLATAIVMRDTLQISDICFVSADEALLKAAAAEQFPVLNPLQI